MERTTMNARLSPPIAGLSWILQLAAAGILAQTLFFKFTGAEESRYIFSTLGVEPWGRIGAGVMELIAAALLLVPRAAAFGAMLAMIAMTGAIGAHLTKLGISVKGDGGLLFGLAITVFVCAAGVARIRRNGLPTARRDAASPAPVDHSDGMEVAAGTCR